MSENWIAVADNTAPRPRSTRWHQQGLKHALDIIHKDHPTDYEHLVYQGAVEYALEYTYTNDGVGPNGWENNLGLDYQFDDQFVDVEYDHDEAWLDRLHLIGNRWIAGISDAIQADQERSIFSEKEFAVFFASRKRSWSAPRAADALGITTGNVQGKQGRINDKLDTVAFTQTLLEETEAQRDRDEAEEWKTYIADFLAIQRADTDDLPVSREVDTESVVRSRAELYLQGDREYGYTEFVESLSGLDGVTEEAVKDELDRLAWKGDINLGSTLEWTGDQ